MLKPSSRKEARAVTSRAQLIRAVQIELHCVQEYTAMDDTCLPEWIMGLIQTHIHAAQELSCQLWEVYGLTFHYHRPWKEEKALSFNRS